MNMMESSIFYRIIQYVAKIHESSFIYKSRKKPRKARSYKKARAPYYRYASVYRLFSTITGGLRKLCLWIHQKGKSSGFIGSFSTAMTAMKKTKVWAFNQLMISIIIGYALTNVAFGIFTKQKLLYLSSFFVAMIVVNVWSGLFMRYEKSSLLVKLYDYMK